MPSRWAVSFAIDGDLRFVSHHDCIRAVERIATRAQLPLKYSEGFNPRPLVSLPCARPVAVPTRGELLVISPDQPVEGEDLVARLNEHAPAGMRFGPAKILEGKGVPQPRRIDYSLDLKAGQSGAVAGRLADLQREKSWSVERLVTTKRKRRREMATRIVDIRALVTSLELNGETLKMTLASGGDRWARPGEVLRLLGLDERADLARLARVVVEYEFQGRPWTASDRTCRQYQ